MTPATSRSARPRFPLQILGLAPALAAPFIAALLLAAGCGPEQEDTTAGIPSGEVERVENPALGIALVGPQAAGFDVVTNEGETLVLIRPALGERAEARLTYEVGPPQTAGVNLVEAVKLQQAEIESRPEGDFLGQVELMSQFGTAFSTRGRYAGGDGREMEEIKIFTIHPSGDRMLSVTYRYPPTAGGTQARLDQGMTALALVEPLAAAEEGMPGEGMPGEGDAAPPAPGEDAGGETAGNL